jgi:putative ribosome biogenesis GTPase RsgA
VRDALVSNDLTPERYDSYLRLLEELESQQQR